MSPEDNNTTTNPDSNLLSILLQEEPNPNPPNNIDSNLLSILLQEDPNPNPPNNTNIDSNLLSILHQDLQQDPLPNPPTNTESPHPPLFHHHHLPSINATILTRSIPSLGLSFQLWPSSLSLLSPLLLPPSPPPLRLLDLGSGTALAPISLAALLPAHVTLTDLPHVLPNLQFNAAANSPLVSSRGGSLAVHQLRWGSREDILKINESELGFDAVIASDVVYHEHLIEPLIETIRVFVKGEVGFLMAHLRRWRKRDGAFFRRAKKFFDVVVVHRDLPVGGERNGVVVYRFTARKMSGVRGLPEAS